MSDPLVAFAVDSLDRDPSSRAEALSLLADADRDKVFSGVSDHVAWLREDNRSVGLDDAEVLERLCVLTRVLDFQVGEIPARLFDDCTRARRSRMLAGVIANRIAIDADALVEAFQGGSLSDRRGAARYYAFCSQRGGSPEFTRRQTERDEQICGPLLELTNHDDGSVRREVARCIRIRVQEGKEHTPHQLSQAADQVSDLLDDDEEGVRREATIAALSLFVLRNPDGGPEHPLTMVFSSLRDAPEGGRVHAHANAIFAGGGGESATGIDELLDRASTERENEVFDNIVLLAPQIEALAEALGNWCLYQTDAAKHRLERYVAMLLSDDDKTAIDGLKLSSRLVIAVRKADLGWTPPDSRDTFSELFGPIRNAFERRRSDLDATDRECGSELIEAIESLTTE